MASAYGILDNFNDPLYTPDFAAISTALEFKQGKLDANREALAKYNDDLINSINVLKDEDKQYANERIEAVTKLVNQYSGQDLSNDGLLMSLKTDLSQVIDDNVKNAVYSTALYNAEQAQWQKQKEENPDKYSDDNYRYAQQNAQAYLSDGKVGSKYKGGGGFIEFKDVQADLNKQLPDRLKEKGIYSTLDDQGNEYYYDTITGQKITNEDVMSVMRTIITPQHEKQLAINAWAKYDHLPDEAIQYQFNQNKSAQVSDLDSDINTIQTLLNDPSVKGQERQQYLAMLPQLKAQKHDVSSQEYSPLNKKGVYTSMYQKEFFGSFANAYSVNKVTEIKRSPKWEKQEEIKFAYDVKLKAVDQANAIELLGVKAMFDAESAKNSTAASGTSTPDLDGDTSTMGGDNLAPSAKGWIPTTAEEAFNPYTQIQNTQAELIGKVARDLFPELLIGGSKKVETMNAIQGFALVKDDNTYNPTDKTYEYVFGVNPNGTPKTKRLTEEQANQIYDLKINTHRYTEATKNVVSVIEDTANDLQEAMVKTTDFNLANLNDYSIEVYTKTNGEKAIRPKSEGSRTFAELLQMKSAGKQLTPDQQETLNLYSQFETVKSFSEDVGDDAAVSHSKAFLGTIQGRYADGGVYIPSDPSAFSNGQKKITYVKPEDYRTGFMEQANPNITKAKKVVADQVFNGVLPKYEGNEDAFTAMLSHDPSTTVFLDRLIYQISKSPDPSNYVISDRDKATLHDTATKFITKPSNGLYDTSFSGASAGDLENNSGYTLAGGKSVPNFVAERNKLITAETDNLLTDYNKKDQNFYLEFNADKKAIHNNINGALTAMQSPYTIKDKGTVYATFEGDNVKVYGDFTSQSAVDGKAVDTKLNPANAISMTKEQFKQITGVEEQKEKITPFNVTFKNPMIEEFTPKPSVILSNQLTEQMSEMVNQVGLRKNDGTPLDIEPTVVANTMNNIKVQIKPIDNTYFVVMSVPTLTNKGQESYTEVPLLDMGTGKPSIEEVKSYMGLYNTSQKVLGDPQAADKIQSIILQNQITFSNLNQ